LDYLKAQGPALVAQYLDAQGHQGVRVETFPKNAGLPSGH
jgi:hypothetical protein